MEEVKGGLGAGLKSRMLGSSASLRRLSPWQGRLFLNKCIANGKAGFFLVVCVLGAGHQL